MLFNLFLIHFIIGGTSKGSILEDEFPFTKNRNTKTTDKIQEGNQNNLPDLNNRQGATVIAKLLNSKLILFNKVTPVVLLKVKQIMIRNLLLKTVLIILKLQVQY